MVDYKFCTIDDVLRYGPIESGFIGYNDLISNSLIPQATRQIQQFCNRDFVSAAKIEYFGTPALQEPFNIYLREMNITSGPTVKYDTTYPSDWSTVDSLESTEYVADTEKGIVTLLIETYHHPRCVQISYTGGYAVGADGYTVAVPSSVRDACAMQAAFLVSRSVSGNLGYEMQRDGKSGSSKPAAMSVTGLIPEARSLVASYRRMITGRFGI